MLASLSARTLDGWTCLQANHHDVTSEHIHRKETTYGRRDLGDADQVDIATSEPENSRRVVLRIPVQDAMPKIKRDELRVFILASMIC